ncbi:site-2 protease family protein [Saccharomonospora saliphila]|uniref:site-2 protease family protein n=1 Tax=Saccharomonospora saliphila TaxID=369829 RepID=UPI000364595A|nr:site-2 protease family protein [Saccharomonospora saliphila]
MRSTVPLGTLAGVRVGVHWSVLGILAVLVVALGTARWPLLVPGYPTGAYVGAALVAALLFLLSLLAHELSHAVVARRNGIEVDEITLWLLGGIAKLRSEARTPGADLRIAAAGPLASVLVAALFGLATWVLVAVDAGVLLVAVPGYLAAINVVLAAFNLIPAAPLDGGRILRAALWAWRGDRVRAAVLSARAGRVFGFALVLLGAWRLLFTGSGDGLWWIVIGLFIVFVAGAEERQAELGAALADVRVGQVMTTDPDTTDGGLTVSEFLHDVALRQRHSAFPLVGPSGRVEGLVTLNRLRAVAPDRRADTTLRETACPLADVPTARADEPLTELLDRMRGCSDGRALVFDGDRLTGIVTSTDISHAVMLHGLGAGPSTGVAGAGRDTAAERPR